MKKRIATSALLILFSFLSDSQAQLTYTFVPITRNTHFGTAQNVAVGPNGSVFLAFGEGGLRAYNYDGASFTNTTYIDEPGPSFEYASGVAVDEKGTVFLASGDGLRAYSYDGVSFTNLAHIYDGGSAKDVALSNDGTVFLANASDGLRAYTYDGVSFTNTAHAPNDIVDGSASDVSVGSSGTVFLVNTTSGRFDMGLVYPDGGLQAFHYDGVSLTQIAHVNDDGVATGIDLGRDEAVFLVSNGHVNFDDREGLRAYRFDGSSFEITDHIDEEMGSSVLTVDLGGTVFVAGDSLRAYSYNDDHLTRIAQTDYVGHARGMASSEDGTVFLASDEGGLSAFSFDGTTFRMTANIERGPLGVAHSTAVGNDGTVFLANGRDGLRAYRYDGVTLNSIAHIDEGDDLGSAENVAIGLDGTVFLANHNDGLRAYSFDGTSFTGVAHIGSGINVGRAVGRPSQDIVVGQDGTVFLANGADGLRAYAYDGLTLANRAHFDPGGFSTIGIAVSPGGVIFVATGDGLEAFTYDGDSFNRVAQTDTEDHASDVALGIDGTVFLAVANGLQAYLYDGTSLVETDRVVNEENEGFSTSVSVGADGTIFLTHSSDGLRAYHYDEASFTLIAHIGSRAYNVTQGPDGTVFVARGNEGLIAYSFSSVPTVRDYSWPIPEENQLFQNYPNPFDLKTNLSFSLARPAYTTLKVFNILGMEIGTLISKDLPAGDHNISWDASALSNGVYIYRLQAGNFIQSRKMILLP